MDDTKRKKVVKMVRDSIVAAAREAEVVKGRTKGFAKKVGDKWEASKPYQQKAVRNMRGAAQDIAAFSQSVAQGVREGVNEVRTSRKDHPLM